MKRAAYPLFLVMLFAIVGVMEAEGQAANPVREAQTHIRTATAALDETAPQRPSRSCPTLRRQGC